METSHEILTCLGQGDRTAFSALYDSYAGQCAGFIDALIHDSESARDLTQDIFVKIWLRRKIVCRARDFEAYLMGMARNAVLDYSKHKKVALRFVTEATGLAKELMGESFDAAEQSETVERLQKAIGKMPPQRRRIFVMSRLQGMNNALISDLTGLSIRTVETHISHALKQLRKEFY